MGVIVRQKVQGKGNPWWVFISHKGRRTSKLVGDKKAAEKVASEIQAQLKLNQFEFVVREKPRIPLFKDFAEGFMQTYSPLHHKPSTQRSYQDSLELYLLPKFGNMPMDSITRKDVKDFIHELYGAGLKSGTIGNHKGYLSAILGDAVDSEIISANPATRTGKLIKKEDESKDINPFSWEEKTVFENTVKEHFPRWWPFFLTALRTGLRLGELIALQPGDLDFNGGFIEVRRTFTRKQVSTTKTGKSRRVDMSRELSETLKSYLVERKKEALRKGWGQPPEWLFYGTEGQIIDGDNLRQRVFRKILDKAGLRHVRIHDLRHTYATLRISKGDNILDVSKQLGHASVKMTLDVYAHWMPGGKKDEVNGLDSKTQPLGNTIESVE